MTLTELAALRGGAPGDCNPIAYGQCAPDAPPGTGCAVNGGTCSTYNDDCVDDNGNPLPANTPCAAGLKNGSNTPQCQNSNSSLGGCVQGNPPAVVCWDNYFSCTCDGKGNCGGNKGQPQYTGKCANATGNF